MAIPAQENVKAVEEHEISAVLCRKHFQHKIVSLIFLQKKNTLVNGTDVECIMPSPHRHFTRLVSLFIAFNEGCSGIVSICQEEKRVVVVPFCNYFLSVFPTRVAGNFYSATLSVLHSVTL